MVECHTCNVEVGGSSPSSGSKVPTWFSGDNTTFVKWHLTVIGSSSLPVGSKIIILILKLWKVMKVLKKENLATWCLFLGTFFNPLGYDAALKWLMDTTGNYWYSISIFYLISLSFFILYFFFTKINPLKIFKFKFLRKKSG